MGYILNDNRASGGALQEWDTVACKHCQAVVKKEIFAKKGGFCGRCFGAICIRCAKRMDKFGCEPFLKEIEIKLKRYRSLKQEGLL